MGQAKQRGSFEQRKAQAIAQNKKKPSPKTTSAAMAKPNMLHALVMLLAESMNRSSNGGK